MSTTTTYLCDTCMATFDEYDVAKLHVDLCSGESRFEATPASTDLTSQPALPEAEASTSQSVVNKEDDKFFWNKNATLALLALYKENEEEMVNITTRKAIVWGKICEGLKSQGYALRVSQVEGKWKTLMKAYKKIVDHNNRSGNDRKSCPFFEELDEMFGMKPNVMPASTSTVGVSESASSADSRETPQKKDGKRKSTTVLEWLKDWSEKKSLEEKQFQDIMKARFEAQERMFERKMDFMERFLKEFSKKD